MGLPLWQPKVESDIPSRPEAKNPALARSVIRGSATRDRRPRIRVATVAREPTLRFGDEAYQRRRDAEYALLEPNMSEEHRAFYRAEVAGRAQERAEIAARNQEQPEPLFVHGLRTVGHGHDPGLGPASQPPVAYGNISEVRLVDPNHRRQAYLGQIYRRSRFTRAARRGGLTSPPPGTRSHQQVPSGNSMELDTALGNDAANVAAPTGPSRSDAGARLDGLGDRNRSLSPEGDSAWDTMVTTLTPDPQPPSVGSSFASAPVSAVTSQSAVPESSGTSLTGPDTAEESMLEQPCDSDEDEDVDEEERLAMEAMTRELEEEVNTLDRMNRDAQTRRDQSYADVVRAGSVSSVGQVNRSLRADDLLRERRDTARARLVRLTRLAERRTDRTAQSHATASAEAHATSHPLSVNARTANSAPNVVTRVRPSARAAANIRAEETEENGRGSTHGTNGGSEAGGATDDLILQLVGGLGGMQHIVRNLVRREDIPNDWWVDAGLSRTLPRDDDDEAIS